MRIASLALAVAFAWGVERAAAATEVPTLSESNVITGTLTLRFGVPPPTTRPTTTPIATTSLATAPAATSPTSQPARIATTALATTPAIVDTCTFDFDVAKTTQFSGVIVRWPDRFSFAVDIAVLNPKNLLQKKTVGRWTGDVPYGLGGYALGGYALAGGKMEHRPLRISIDAIGKAQASADPFGGKLRLWDASEETSGPRHYDRTVGDERVRLDAARVLTLGFQRVELAKGPAPIYPHTSVTGRVDFDPTTQALILDGITFASLVEGNRQIDRMSGTIRWLPDRNDATNSRGEYAVNLSFASPPSTQPTTLPAATTRAPATAAAGRSDFFTPDPAAASLIGTIVSTTTYSPSTSELASRRYVFQIHANRVGKPQILNVFKLFLLSMVPAMDVERPR